MTNNIFIPVDDYLFEQAIEQVVKYNGCFISSGMTLERHVERFKIAEKFVEQYNPRGLTIEEYKTMYPNGRD